MLAGINNFSQKIITLNDASCGRKAVSFGKLNPLSKDTVSFGSHSGVYKTENGKDMITSTCLFREGDWHNLPKVLESRFANKEHVNIISHACSDGAEPYSIAIMLLEKLGPERAKKFLPIKATDINKNLIDFANSGYIELSKRDFHDAECMGIDLEKYFTYEPDQSIKTPLKPFNNQLNALSGEKKTYKVNQELRDLVQFEEKDFFDDLEKLEDDANTVLLFRNALQHIYPINNGADRKENLVKAEEFFHKVGEKLKGKSLFIIGLQDPSLYEIKCSKHDVKFELVEDDYFPLKLAYSKVVD